MEFCVGSSNLVGYADSDYAGDLDKRRSLTNSIFILRNSAISWKSNLLSTITLSTTEAKYKAVTEAIKEAIWLQGLYNELILDHQEIVVFRDSQSAVHLTEVQMFHGKTKHIDVRYHFIHEIIAEGNIIATKIGTANSPADMLIKPLPLAKFRHCLNLTGVHST